MANPMLITGKTPANAVFLLRHRDKSSFSLHKPTATTIGTDSSHEGIIVDPCASIEQQFSSYISSTLSPSPIKCLSTNSSLLSASGTNCQLLNELPPEKGCYGKNCLLWYQVISLFLFACSIFLGSISYDGTFRKLGSLDFAEMQKRTLSYLITYTNSLNDHRKTSINTNNFSKNCNLNNNTTELESTEYGKSIEAITIYYRLPEKPVDFFDRRSTVLVCREWDASLLYLPLIFGRLVSLFMPLVDSCYDELLIEDSCCEIEELLINSAVRGSPIIFSKEIISNLLTYSYIPVDTTDNQCMARSTMDINFLNTEDVCNLIEDMSPKEGWKIAKNVRTDKNLTQQFVGLEPRESIVCNYVSSDEKRRNLKLAVQFLRRATGGFLKELFNFYKETLRRYNLSSISPLNEGLREGHIPVIHATNLEFHIGGLFSPCYPFHRQILKVLTGFGGLLPYALLLAGWSHSILSQSPLTLVHIPRLFFYIFFIVYRTLILYVVGNSLESLMINLWKESSVGTANEFEYWKTDFSDHIVLMLLILLICSIEFSAAGRAHAVGSIISKVVRIYYCIITIICYYITYYTARFFHSPMEAWMGFIIGFCGIFVVFWILTEGIKMPSLLRIGVIYSRPHKSLVTQEVVDNFAETELLEEAEVEWDAGLTAGRLDRSEICTISD